MKATGIVRRVDELGRVVIPKEIRRVRGFEEGTPLEIFVDDNDGIVLKLYNPGCDSCRAAGLPLTKVGNVSLCVNCIDKIKRA